MRLDVAHDRDELVAQFVRGTVVPEDIASTSASASASAAVKLRIGDGGGRRRRRRRRRGRVPELSAPGLNPYVALALDPVPRVLRAEMRVPLAQTGHLHRRIAHGDHDHRRHEQVQPGLEEQRDVAQHGGAAGEVVVQQGAEHGPAHGGVDYGVELFARGDGGGVRAEDAAAEGGTVEGPAVGGVGWVGGVEGQEEVRGRGGEGAHNRAVGWSAGLDDAAGEEVGVD